MGTLPLERRNSVEPNKKLAREHGTKSGQIAIKGAITQPDLTGVSPGSSSDMIAAREIVDPGTSRVIKSNTRPVDGGPSRPTATSAATFGADVTGPSEPHSED
jgi:hypothetical protein